MLAVTAGCGKLADVPDHGATAGAGPSGNGNGGVSGGSSSTGIDPGPPDSGVIVTADGGATTRSAGRCAKDADCGPNGHCVELVTGGYRVCSYPPPAPQMCQNGQPSSDECCGATCMGGEACTLQTSCGGAFIEPYNVCAKDQCSANSDCGPTEICLPTGVGSPYSRTCMPTSNECLRHSDCNAAPDGICALIGTVGPASMCSPWTCGGGTSTTQVATDLRCIYAGGCADDADCPKGHCENTGGGPTCQPGMRQQCPPPP